MRFGRLPAHLVATALVSLGGAALVLAQGAEPSAAVSARKEAEEGLRLLQSRDWAGAEVHLERSLALDGSSTPTRFWLGRALSARFRESRDPSERSDLARRALAAYEQVLAADPGNAEAYQALLGVAREADDRTAVPVLERLAGDERLSASARAGAYLTLATRDRTCAEERLQAIASEPVLAGSSGDARACASRGLTAVDKALALDSERESAWRERASLFACLAQAAALEGKTDEQAGYEKRAGESRRRAEQLRASRARKTTPRSY